MKKNNGFTLIELLAVIIILAVIALIATPIVLNVVDGAKKSAAESSVRGYVDAIQMARYDYIITHDGQEPTKEEVVAMGNTVKVKGEKPESCVVDLVDGVVVASGCDVKSYTKDGKASVDKEGKVTWTKDSGSASTTE